MPRNKPYRAPRKRNIEQIPININHHQTHRAHFSTCTILTRCCVCVYVYLSVYLFMRFRSQFALNLSASRALWQVLAPVVFRSVLSFPRNNAVDFSLYPAFMRPTATATCPGKCRALNVAGRFPACTPEPEQLCLCPRQTRAETDGCYFESCGYCFRTNSR